MTDNTVPEGKADVPASQLRRAEKYGMPAQYAHRIVERHFGIADEQLSLEAGAVAADIEVSKALIAMPKDGNTIIDTRGVLNALDSKD